MFSPLQDSIGMSPPNRVPPAYSEQIETASQMPMRPQRPMRPMQRPMSTRPYQMPWMQGRPMTRPYQTPGMGRRPMPGRPMPGRPTMPGGPSMPKQPFARR